MAALYLYIHREKVGEDYLDIPFAALGMQDPVVLTLKELEVWLGMVEQGLVDKVVMHDALLSPQILNLVRDPGFSVFSSLVEHAKVRDTKVMERHAHPPVPGEKADYSLQATARRYALPFPYRGENVLEGAKRVYGYAMGFIDVRFDPTCEAVRYGMAVVEATREVYRRLVPQWGRYVEREHRALWAVGAIARHGVRYDQVRAESMSAQRKARVEAHLQWLNRTYGMPISGKAPHFSEAGRAAIVRAFEDHGVKPPYTKGGVVSLKAERLRAIAQEHAADEAVVLLCESLASLVGERSVADMLLAHDAGSKVYPTVDASQVTGRISLTQPGLTVMGKRSREGILERSLILPDNPDEVLICADLSQIDARVMAALSGDRAYLAAFAEGKDYHAEMAEAIFGDRSRRDEAKVITHATTYGMGSKSLARAAGVSEERAQEMLHTLKMRFPALDRYKWELRNFAKDRGYVRSGYFRKVMVDADRVFTQAPAFAGQSTARDLMMEGILRLPVELRERLRLIIHDEIVLSVPKKQAAWAQAELKRALEFTFTPAGSSVSVPVFCELSDAGEDWADCYRSEKTQWPEVARSNR